MKKIIEIRTLMVIMVIFLMNGCHTPLISKQSLKPTSISREITLVEPLSRWQGRDVQWIAKPGKYIAVLEGEGGTFFKGASNCIEGRLPNGVLVLTQDGGIWLKSSDEKVVRFYAHEGTRTHFSPEGKQVYSERTANSKDADVPSAYLGTPTPSNSQLVGGALAGAIVGAMVTLDTERIMFQSDEFTLATQLNSN